MWLHRFSFSSERLVSSTSLGSSSTSKISVGNCFIMHPARRLGGGAPKREIETCTPIGFRLRPDAAPVPMDNSLNYGQTNPGAFEVLGAVQTLKNSKKLVDIAHVEAHAVVAHKEAHFAAGDLSSHLDHRRITRAGELHRVPQQVGEYLSQQDGIADGFRQRGNPPLDRALPDFRS